MDETVLVPGTSEWIKDAPPFDAISIKSFPSLNIKHFSHSTIYV